MELKEAREIAAGNVLAERSMTVDVLDLDTGIVYAEMQPGPLAREIAVVVQRHLQKRGLRVGIDYGRA